MSTDIIPGTDEGRQHAADLVEWHFAATAPGADVPMHPDVAADAEKLRAIATDTTDAVAAVALESTDTEIPADVKAELDAFRARVKADRLASQTPAESREEELIELRRKRYS